MRHSNILKEIFLCNNNDNTKIFKHSSGISLPPEAENSSLGVFNYKNKKIKNIKKDWENCSIFYEKNRKICYYFFEVRA